MASVRNESRRILSRGQRTRKKKKKKKRWKTGTREKDGGRWTMAMRIRAYTRAKPDIIVVIVVVYFAHLGTTAARRGATTSPFTVREETRASAVVTWTAI